MQDVFSTLPQMGEVTNYVAAVAALNAYFIPQVNAYARQTFHKLFQKQGETVQQFCTRLRHAAKDCDFQEDRDNHIRDAILSKKAAWRKLLEEGPGLKLSRALEVTSQCERVEEQLATMSITGEKKEGNTVNRSAMTKKEKYIKPKEKMKEDNKTDSVIDASILITVRIPNAQHEDKHVTSAMVRTTFQKCVAQKDI